MAIPNNTSSQAKVAKEYPIMELTYGTPTAETAIDIRTGETIPSGDEVFYHKGTPLRISFLNDQFGKNNYKVLTSSDGRKFVVHKGHQGLTDSDIQLFDWSNSDNSFDRTLAQAYKSTGLKPNTDNEEEEPGFWQGLNNAMKREFGWLGYGGKDSSRFRSNNAAYRRDPHFMNNWGINLSREEAEVIPFVGDGVSAAGVVNDFAKGDYAKAGMNALWFFVPNIVEKPIRWMARTPAGTWVKHKVADGASNVWNWLNKEHDLTEKAYNLLGYEKVYHGTPHDFQIRDFKPSAANMGLHVTREEGLAKSIAKMRSKSNNYNVLSGYVKKHDYPLVIDMYRNDYNMLNPEFKFTNQLYSSVPGDPLLQIQHSVTPGSQIIKHPDSDMFVPGPGTYGQTYTANLQEINWPNMPEHAKKQYSQVMKDVQEGKITNLQANLLVQNIFKDNGVPIVQYRNVAEGINRKHPYDLIIFDPDAIKFTNSPQFKVKNWQLGLGAGAGAGIGAGLWYMNKDDE